MASPTQRHQIVLCMGILRVLEGLVVPDVVNSQVRPCPTINTLTPIPKDHQLADPNPRLPVSIRKSLAIFTLRMGVKALTGAEMGIAGANITRTREIRSALMAPKNLMDIGVVERI